MKKINGSIFKFLGKLFKLILVTIVVFLVINITYLFFSYDRIPDNEGLEINIAKEITPETLQVDASKTLKAISYNAGFAAYLPDFTFFMDGGSQSWAKSKESVIETSQNIANVIKEQDADFVSMQEVDSDSTRTYHVDETKIIRQSAETYFNVNACCFKSPFLFWPIYQPHGESTSNLMTLSKYMPRNNAIRRQFPVDNSFTKILDYDRCYSVVRYPTSNGKELVYYTTHMSAYSQDPTTAENQIKQIVADMQSECEKGNYCICGADFNKQLINNPEKYYPDYKIYETKPFPTDLLAGTNISVVAPFNEKKPIPTCRDAGQPWGDKDPVCNIDGFLISSNVQLIEADAVDIGFQYSDHNPVYMTFILQ